MSRPYPLPKGVQEAEAKTADCPECGKPVTPEVREAYEWLYGNYDMSVGAFTKHLQKILGKADKLWLGPELSLNRMAYSVALAVEETTGHAPDDLVEAVRHRMTEGR